MGLLGNFYFRSALDQIRAVAALRHLGGLLNLDTHNEQATLGPNARCGLPIPERAGEGGWGAVVKGQGSRVGADLSGCAFLPPARVVRTHLHT